MIQKPKCFHVRYSLEEWEDRDLSRMLFILPAVHPQLREITLIWKHCFDISFGLTMLLFV